MHEGQIKPIFTLWDTILISSWYTCIALCVRIWYCQVGKVITDIQGRQQYSMSSPLTGCHLCSQQCIISATDAKSTMYLPVPRYISSNNCKRINTINTINIMQPKWQLQTAGIQASHQGMLINLFFIFPKLILWVKTAMWIQFSSPLQEKTNLRALPSLVGHDSQPYSLALRDSLKKWVMMPFLASSPVILPSHLPLSSLVSIYYLVSISLGGSLFLALGQ